MRQKAEQTVKDAEAAEYDKKHGKNGNEDEGSDEDETEYYDEDDYGNEDDAGSTKSSPEANNLKKTKISQ